MERNDTSRAKEKVLMAVEGKYPESEAARGASRRVLDDVETMFREIGSRLPAWLEVSRSGDNLTVGSAIIAIRRRTGRIGIFPYSFTSDPYPQPVLCFNASTGQWDVPNADDPAEPQNPVEAIVEILLPGMVEGAERHRKKSLASGEQPSPARVPQFSRGMGSPVARKRNPMARSRATTLGQISKMVSKK